VLTEDYCRVEAWKRLKEKGYSPSESIKIADEIYAMVKKAHAKNIRPNGPECGCEMDSPPR
jgi:hypothetical protein